MLYPSNIALNFQELFIKGPSVHPYLLYSKLEMQRTNYSKAMDYLHTALDLENVDLAPVWETIGIRTNSISLCACLIGFLGISN